MIDYNDIELGVNLFRRQYPVLFDALSLDEDCKLIEEVNMNSHSENIIRQAILDFVKSGKEELTKQSLIDCLVKIKARDGNTKLGDNPHKFQYRWVGSSRTENFMMVEVKPAIMDGSYIGIAKIKGTTREEEDSARIKALKDALNKMMVSLTK